MLSAADWGFVTALVCLVSCVGLSIADALRLIAERVQGLRVEMADQHAWDCSQGRWAVEREGETIDLCPDCARRFDAPPPTPEDERAP